MTAVGLVSEVTNCIDSANSFLERKRRQREGGGATPEGGGLSANGGFSGGGNAPSVFAQLLRPSRQGSPPSFDTVDMNHDGVIIREEYNVALSGEVPPPPTHPQAPACLEGQSHHSTHVHGWMAPGSSRAGL